MFVRIFFFTWLLFLSPLALASSGKLLVILNQKSGQGKSEKIFKEKAEKKLRKKYELEVFKANGGKEAYHYIKAHKNLESFSGILGFGGDGTQNKILKALFKRNMLDKLPLGVIPTGSGNALASSIFAEDKTEGESYSVEAMLSRVLGGKTSPLSLYSYKTDLGKKGISALGVSLGILADIDIDSEPFRFMGKARFDFVGFFKWIGLKSYPATVEIITEKGQKKYLQGPFRQFLALGVSHLSEGVLLAPQANFREKLLHLSFIAAKEAHHCEMFRYLDRLGKKASLLPFVHHVQAKEIKVILKAENKITVDGKWLDKETRTINFKPLPVRALAFTREGL